MNNYLEINIVLHMLGQAPWLGTDINPDVVHTPQGNPITQETSKLGP